MGLCAYTMWVMRQSFISCAIASKCKSIHLPQRRKGEKQMKTMSMSAVHAADPRVVVPPNRYYWFDANGAEHGFVALAVP